MNGLKNASLSELVEEHRRLSTRLGMVEACIHLQRDRDLEGKKVRMNGTQAAKFLGVGRTTLHRWKRSGLLSPDCPRGEYSEQYLTAKRKELT